MVKTERQDRAVIGGCSEKTCCQELLQEAIGGAVPADQFLERMLDYLERTS